MSGHVKQHRDRLSGQTGRETRLIGLFLLGLLMLMPPMLAVFNREGLLLGIPILYLYLFLAWLGLIGLIARQLRHGPEQE
jgi:hypothetical protein